MVTALIPRPFLALISTVGLFACTPDAKNGPAKVPSENNSEEPTEDTEASSSQSPEGETNLEGRSSEKNEQGNPLNPENSPSTKPSFPPDPSDAKPIPPRNLCPKDKDFGDHVLVVRPLAQLPAEQNGLEVDFANQDDRSLQVVSLYVNKPEDKIPTFKNNFKFDGTSYWMVAVENPFEEFFSLPNRYKSLPNFAVDVTKRYGGVLGGLDLKNLKEPTCLKFTVVTFEPEKDVAFRQSEIRYPYDPKNSL
jgi:hypothetical protein